MEKPEAITSPGVHEEIAKLLSKEDKNKKVLDLGAGYGALSFILKKQFKNITAADLHPENFKLKEIKCVKTDINKKFPFKNDSFDVVCCAEVVEHIKTPWQLIDECFRILKKDGILILSTPNNENWYSRLQFLFSGTLTNFPGPAYNRDRSLNWDSHITPIFSWTLNYMIKDKFAVKKVAFNRSNVPILRISLPFTGKLFGETSIYKLISKK